MTTCAEKDRNRLRELGSRVRELAELPVMRENTALWTKVNDLRMERPVLHHRDTSVVLLNHDDELTPRIADPFLKMIELELLLRLYSWKHMPLNQVVRKTLHCQCVVEDDGWGDIASYKGVQDGVSTGDMRNKESVHFKASIETIDDVGKIRTPRVAYNEEATLERLGLLKDVFDGILDVRLFGRQYFRIAPWDDIMDWLGMGDALMYFYTDPDLMHACIDRYTQCAMAWVRQYEDLGLLSSNNDFENVLNNDPGYTSQLPAPTATGIGCRLKDMWGGSSDQIFTSVSPEISREYAFGYEKSYAELFGLYGYGCCERLDHKMGDLKAAFPNLRKVSVSPYSEVESSFEQLGRGYVACFKPNSNFLALSNFEEAKELCTRELERALRAAQKYGNNLVVNMKTIIDLRDDPSRLWWWCDMAAKMVEKHYN